MSRHIHAQDGVTFSTEIVKSGSGDLHMFVIVTHIKGHKLVFPRSFSCEIEPAWNKKDTS